MSLRSDVWEVAKRNSCFAGGRVEQGGGSSKWLGEWQWGHGERIQQGQNPQWWSEFQGPNIHLSFSLESLHSSALLRWAVRRRWCGVKVEDPWYESEMRPNVTVGCLPLITFVLSNTVFEDQPVWCILTALYWKCLLICDWRIAAKSKGRIYGTVVRPAMM